MMASRELEKILNPESEFLAFDFGEIAKVNEEEKMEELLMNLIKDGEGQITFAEGLKGDSLKMKRINFIKDNKFQDRVARKFCKNFTKVYFEIVEKEEIESKAEKEKLANRVLIGAYKSIEGDVEINYIR